MTIEQKKDVYVLSLGAGVQSSAMLVAYLNSELKPMPDFAVFADTQVEPDEVYQWLAKLKELSAGRIEIIQATRGNLCEDHLEMKRSASIPFFIKNPDDSQGMAWRQCTSEYKISVIKKAVRDKLG